jgi:KamA family protein
LNNGNDKDHIQMVANRIRWQLNPHPAGQVHNIPVLDGEQLHGMQHKYRETVLFFPSQGQTCHAFCSFCFRWPQFVGIDNLKFAMQETQLLVEYIRRHPEASDVLFTGGDPLIMKAQNLAAYIDPILEADISHLQSIRLGSKVLAYWPHRFLTDPDAKELLALFKKVVRAGKHLALMAHFNHPRELSTDAVKEAIHLVRQTGAEIRTQSPLLRHINDDANIWADMWQEQVNLGCIPYYMFVARDTGAQHYFGVPLLRARQIFNRAYRQVSGLARTVRGPSMSCEPGKVQVLGTTQIKGEKVIGLTMLQGRNPNWVGRPFFAQYDEEATWLNELKPAFGKDKFFFEEELEEVYHIKIGTEPVSVS